MIIRRVREPRGWVWRIAVPAVRTVFSLVTRPRWINGSRIPEEGGCLVVVNHISEVDPLVVAHFIYNNGRVPRFLAKSALFRNPLLGAVMRGLGQVPVERDTRSALAAYGKAVAAIDGGDLVVVYPEGTITRDPQLWPMTSKTGAARIALETRCLVVPVGQWGAQDLLAPYSRRPRLFPRTAITMLVGEPLELDDLYAQPMGGAVITETTDRIVAAITDLVETIRDEPAPEHRFDMRTDLPRPA